MVDALAESPHRTTAVKYLESANAKEVFAANGVT